MRSMLSLPVVLALVAIVAVVALVACGSSKQPATAAPPQEDEHRSGTDRSHAGHHGGGMHHRFEDPERWAKVFDDPKRDEWQQPDQVIAALELAPAMVVADIGAGTGYFAMRHRAREPQGKVIATDLEAGMVEHMRERAAKEQLANVEAKQTPPDDPQLGERTVDRVLVVDVWHHLGDRAAYAKKLAAALRDGGRVMVVDFKLDATMGPPKQHRLPPEAIIADLKAAGLDAAVAPVALREQYIVVGTRR